MLYSDVFIVKVKIQLKSSPQLDSTLQLSHELLCSDVFTVKVKIQLKSSPQLASTHLNLGLNPPEPWLQPASTCAAGLAWLRVEVIQKDWLV